MLACEARFSRTCYREPAPKPLTSRPKASAVTTPSSVVGPWAPPARRGRPTSACRSKDLAEAPPGRGSQHLLWQMALTAQTARTAEWQPYFADRTESVTEAAPVRASQRAPWQSATLCEPLFAVTTRLDAVLAATQSASFVGNPRRSLSRSFDAESFTSACDEPSASYGRYLSGAAAHCARARRIDGCVGAAVADVIADCEASGSGTASCATTLTTANSISGVTSMASTCADFDCVDYGTARPRTRETSGERKAVLMRDCRVGREVVGEMPTLLMRDGTPRLLQPYIALQAEAP